MLKLSSSRGIRIDVSVLSVSWSVVDHSVIIQALANWFGVEKCITMVSCRMIPPVSKV